MVYIIVVASRFGVIIGGGLLVKLGLQISKTGLASPVSSIRSGEVSLSTHSNKSLACFIQEANHSGVIHVLRLLASSGRYHAVSRLVSLPKYAGGLCMRRPSQAEVHGTPMGAGDRSQHSKSLAYSWGFDPRCSRIRLTICQVAWKLLGVLEVVVLSKPPKPQ